ncbi:MAG: glycoside hydrolase family 71/99-like protein [Planctomycetota bacterium]
MRVLLVWIAAILSLVPVTTAAAQPRLPSDKLLLTHYMPWYKTPAYRDAWGGHWTGFRKQHDPERVDKNGLSDIWSNYHPLIGLYDSADPDVLECHLLQMKLAGVDGVIVDWYGISDANDYPDNQQASIALFEACERLGMRFAVMFEDRTVEQLVKQGGLDEDDADRHLAETIRWLADNWFDSPHYVRIDGRPLLMNFGPVYLKDPEIWERGFAASGEDPAFFALHHLWEGIGADGGFTWVHSSVYQGEPSTAEIKARIRRVFQRTADEPADVIVSALAGFDDVYENGYPSVDHRDGQTLREHLEVAMSGPWPIVQLVTWNDYGEGTMIEPTHEFGYTFLEVVQASRRAEMRARFRFDTDDLRLPARLLELRRAKTAPDRELDLIADLLSGGETARASAALERLGG